MSGPQPLQPAFPPPMKASTAAMAVPELLESVVKLLFKDKESLLLIPRLRLVNKLWSTTIETMLFKELAYGLFLDKTTGLESWDPVARHCDFSSVLDRNPSFGQYLQFLQIREGVRTAQLQPHLGRFTTFSSLKTLDFVGGSSAFAALAAYHAVEQFKLSSLKFLSFSLRPVRVQGERSVVFEHVQGFLSSLPKLDSLVLALSYERSGYKPPLSDYELSALLFGIARQLKELTIATGRVVLNDPQDLLLLLDGMAGLTSLSLDFEWQHLQALESQLPNHLPTTLQKLGISALSGDFVAIAERLVDRSYLPELRKLPDIPTPSMSQALTHRLIEGWKQRSKLKDLEEDLDCLRSYLDEDEDDGSEEE